MKLETLKDLEKVIQVCRKHGVTSIEVDGVKLSLLPKTLSKVSKQPVIDFDPDPLANVQVPQYTPMVRQETAQETVARIKEELTDEQMLFYSAVGPTDHMIGEQ